MEPNANGGADRVIDRLKARRLPAHRGGTGRYLVVCCHTIEAGLYQRLRSWALSGAEHIIVVTETTPSQKPAWEAIRQGASDVVHVDDVDGIADRLDRWLQIDALIAAPIVTATLVGESPRWVKLLREVIDLARFSNINVLLGGESGTGKELVAHVIHNLDPRTEKGELVTVDCTTIVPTLAGSELFGHEKGAFTGADRAREGAFAHANGGTLFLDEIGELSLPLQAELLRVIQEGTFKPVGSDRWRKTAFRLVCATHWDLSAAVLNGTFRQDLYFRIASAVIGLPPLRDRTEDIPQLAAHFLEQMRPGCAGFDPLVLEFLRAKKWPGNVRELRQFVQRVAARHCGSGPVTVGALPREEILHHRPAQARGVVAPAPVEGGSADLGLAVRELLKEGIRLREIAQRVSDLAVELVVQEEKGNLQRAAQRLGVTDRALQQRRQRKGSGEGRAIARPLRRTMPPISVDSDLPPPRHPSPRTLPPVRRSIIPGQYSSPALLSPAGAAGGVVRRAVSLPPGTSPADALAQRSIAPRYGPPLGGNQTGPRFWGLDEDLLGPDSRAGLQSLPPMPEALRQSLVGKGRG